jgi:hypothetical protein
MASGGKKKTTFAKLARESRLRERRLDKQAKKDARKRAHENQPMQPGDAQIPATERDVAQQERTNAAAHRDRDLEP